MDNENISCELMGKQGNNFVRDITLYLLNVTFVDCFFSLSKNETIRQKGVPIDIKQDLLL